MTREVHVLCEGFHDRDFLAGWFETVAGWTDPTNGGTRPLALFAEEKVNKGAYLFTKQDCVICLGPMQGRPRLRNRLREWLEEIRTLESPKYAGIIVVAGGDHLPSETADPVESLVRQELGQAGSPPAGPLPWKHLSVDIDVVSMRTGPVRDIPGLPQRETLERIVATAFARAYPKRFVAMMNWLGSRPDLVGSTPKTVNWSIMAGWFAEGGCTDFLRRAVWADAAMCAQLQGVVQATGLIAVEARLCGG